MNVSVFILQLISTGMAQRRVDDVSIFRVCSCVLQDTRSVSH